MSAVSDAVMRVLGAHRFSYQNEKELQNGIEVALKQASVLRYTLIRREFELNDKDTIDFMVEHLGIEVKVKGSMSAVTRQLHRYASSTDLDELLLVTTRAQHKLMPAQMQGKEIHVFVIGGLW